jgi:hypothetical protein
MWRYIMNEEIEKKIGTASEDQVDVENKAGSELEPEHDLMTEKEDRIKKPPSRFSTFLKRALILLLVLLVVFGAGWLTSWKFKYQPMAADWKASEEGLSTAKEKINDLESQLVVLKGVEQDKLSLQQTLTESQMHIVLLRLLSDINAARFALLDDDSANARLYLKPVPERVIELGDYLGSENADAITNMQKRLVLIDTEITGDPVTAQTDLSVLANNLLQIESVFFTVP